MAHVWDSGLRTLSPGGRKLEGRGARRYVAGVHCWPQAPVAEAVQFSDLLFLEVLPTSCGEAAPLRFGLQAVISLTLLQKLAPSVRPSGTLIPYQ